MSEEDEGRDHEPSQKKLEDARKKGDIARSADLTQAAAFGGLVIALFWMAPAVFEKFGKAAMVFLRMPDHPGPEASGAILRAVLVNLPILLAPFLGLFLLPAAFAAASLLGQRAILFAPGKLAPNWSRLDVLANARQKFAGAGLADFVRALAKLVAVLIVASVFLATRLDQILQAALMPARQAVLLWLGLGRDFLIRMLAVAVVIGALDYLWQVHAHGRRLRMTLQELREEFRESEGDPHVKGERRRRAQEIAMNRMLADVPGADVIVVNPTHYAVALRWSRKSGRAPVCVAKGVDEIAARIREAALAAGVPIHSDPPTARAIYSTVDIGREISPDHYAPVAAAIRYAERMRKRARERGLNR